MGTMRTLWFTFVLNVIALGALGQPSSPPDEWPPQRAYQQLLTIRSFAFGGIGFAGRTSEGEAAYQAIAASTNALALFSGVFTNGNAQAKLYALCGIQRFAPGRFASYAGSLRAANPEVETIQGCIISHEFAIDVISRISAGSYDLYSGMFTARLTNQ
jgi:hypothetical protein